MASRLLTSTSTSKRNATAWEVREHLGPILEASTRVRRGTVPIVSLRGELDIAGADALEDLVLEVLLRHGPDVVIDASGLVFCDATGLGALVWCANEAGRAGGRLTVVRPSHRLCRLMRLVDLDRLLCACSVPAPRQAGGSCSTMSTDPC